MASPKWKDLSKYAACDIADALLKLKVPGAGFLPDIIPIPHTPSFPRPEPKKIIAPASTFLMVSKASPSFPSPAPTSKDLPESNTQDLGPYADYTTPNTIVLISQPPNQTCAVVGGIMAARMKNLGARAIIVDGRVRDLVALADTEMPIWSRGTSVIGAGAETKFHAREVAVRIGETVVQPGDIVMVDELERGVVVVPWGMVEEVLRLLPEMVASDERVLGEVVRGGSVKEAFKRHRNA